jgi:hypothetical protein
MESVTSLDETKILGYFENIKGNFFLKTTIESLAFNKKGKFILSISDEIKNLMESTFGDYNRFTKYLYHGNGAIKNNFHDSIINDLIIGSWVCFELIIKDLAKKDYSLINHDQTINYRANKLGLSDDEKDNLELFYYIRNAFSHYNGAYYKSKSIEHTYNGILFNSLGKEGNKIYIPDLKFAFKIFSDIEAYTLKAWNNCQKINKKII